MIELLDITCPECAHRFSVDSSNLQDLLDEAVQNYIDSDEFCEDAEEYCRETGWTPPG